MDNKILKTGSPSFSFTFLKKNFKMKNSAKIAEFVKYTVKCQLYRFSVGLEARARGGGGVGWGISIIYDNS